MNVSIMYIIIVDFLSAGALHLDTPPAVWTWHCSHWPSLVSLEVQLSCCRLPLRFHDSFSPNKSHTSKITTKCTCSCQVFPLGGVMHQVGTSSNLVCLRVFAADKTILFSLMTSKKNDCVSSTVVQSYRAISTGG